MQLLKLENQVQKRLNVDLHNDIPIIQWKT